MKNSKLIPLLHSRWSCTLGDFVPVKLGMDEGESAKFMIATSDYSGILLFFYENGKVAKVSLKAYETKTNRKKLTGAYSDKSPLVDVCAMTEDVQMAVFTTDGRAVIFSTAQLLPKTTRNTIGVSVVSLKKKASVSGVQLLKDCGITNPSRYRTRNIPSAGALLKEEDAPEKQISFEV